MNRKSTPLNAAPTRAFGLMAILLASMMAGLVAVPTAAADADGSVRFQALNESNLDTDGAGPFIPTVKGWGAAVLINLTDADLTDPTWPVLVKSTTDTSGEEIRLQRVERQGTFAYHGFVGFETSLVPNNGRVHVRDDDRVTVTYVDTRDLGGLAKVRQDTLIWDETHDGEIRLDGKVILGTYDFFGIDEEAEVEVRDKDVTTSTFNVRVTSDSDPVGFTLALNRQANGFHRGNFLFTDGATSPPRIRVADGDKVYVQYASPGTDARGRAETALIEAVWQETHTGRIQFMAEDFRSIVSENPADPVRLPVIAKTPTGCSPTSPPCTYQYTGGVKDRIVYGVSQGSSITASNAWVRVEDLDLAGRGTIMVNVRSHEPDPAMPPSNVDPTGVNIELRETAFRSGEFIGSVGFVFDKESSPACPPAKDNLGLVVKECRLRVKPDAIVIARYDDENDKSGNFQLVEARVRWNQTVTGRLEFKSDPNYLTTTSQYNITSVPNGSPQGCMDGAGNRVRCIPTVGYLQLDDKDLAGHQTVTVRLFNLNRDPLGIELILLESCPASDATCDPDLPKSGVFRAPFRFNHTHSNVANRVYYNSIHGCPGTIGPPVAVCVEEQIWALCNDVIVAEYLDERDEAGKTSKVQTAAVGRSPGCTPPRDSVLGTGQGDQIPRGVKMKQTATSTKPVTALYGYSNVWIELTDWHHNQSSTTVETNRRVMLVTTGYQPGQWIVDSAWRNGEELQNTGIFGTQMNAQMTETAANTGVFRGQFQLVPPGTQVQNQSIGVRPGELVCVYWLYRNGTNQNFSVENHCVPWYPAVNATVEFRSAQHQGARLFNVLGAPAAAAQFYNGIGSRFLYNQDLNRLTTSQAYVWISDSDDMLGEGRHKSIWADRLMPPSGGTAQTELQFSGNTVDGGVQIKSESDQQGITIPVIERYGRPELSACRATFGGSDRVGASPCPAIGVSGTGGYFRPAGTFNSVQDDRGYMGLFNFTTTGINVNSVAVSDEKNDNLLVRDRGVGNQQGDTVSMFYVDPYDYNGVTRTFVAYVDWNETFTGSIEIGQDGVARADLTIRDGVVIYRNQTSATDPRNTVTITVRDRDWDLSPLQERIAVPVVEHCTGNTVLVTLEETAPSSGVFIGKFRFNATHDPANSRLGIKDECTFTVTYMDLADINGIPRTVTAKGQWFDYASTRITFDKNEYQGYGAVMNISLEDINHDRSTGLDFVQVWVISESDGAGEYVKLIETGGRTGKFTASVPFQTSRTAQDGALFVRDGDRITAYLMDFELDKNPPLNDDRSVKLTTAKWRLLANERPIVSMTIAPKVQGDRAGSIDQTKTPILIPLDLTKTDRFPAVFNITMEDPDTKTARRPLGNITRWELDFGDSAVNRESQLVGTVSGRLPKFNSIEHVYRVEGDFTACLTAWDNDNASATTCIPVSVIKLDERRPDDLFKIDIIENKTNTMTVRWTAGGNNAGRDDKVPVSRYEVIVDRSEILLGSRKDFEKVPLATNVTFSPASPHAVAGQTQTVTIGGLAKSTRYYVAVRPCDLLYPGFLAGTCADYAVASATTLDRDDTPPIGPLGGITSSHLPNLLSPNANVTMRWQPVTDKESAVRYSYVLNQEPTYKFTGASGERSPTPASANETVIRNVPDGTYYFHLQACSDGGCIPAGGAAVTYGKIIIEVPREGPIVIPPPLKNLTIGDVDRFNNVTLLTVTRQGSDNVVTWRLSPTVPPCCNIAGVQIWYRDGTGAYQELVDLSKETTAFKEKKYIDKDAPKTRAYKVTTYFNDGGQLVGHTTNPSDLPSFDGYREEVPLASKGKSGMAPWLIALLAIIGLLGLAALVVGVIYLVRNKDDDGLEGGDDEWGGGGDAGWNESASEQWPADDAPEGGLEPDEPVAEEEPAYADEAEVVEEPEPPTAADPFTHHLTCPSCSAGFVAQGEKPLVTQCPSCGVRGILR